MRVEIVIPCELGGADVARWRALLAADPELSSPYLTPDWAQLVGRWRKDVRLAVFRGPDGVAAGFLAVQRPNSRAAMPAGGPVCDYQALVGPPGLDLGLAVRELRVGRVDLPAGLQSNAVGEHLMAHDAGHVVRFPGGFDAWRKAREAAGTRSLGKTLKKLSKLTRDNDGEVSLDAFSRDAAAFETLLQWKREQMRRTGVTDIFAQAWIDGLVRETFSHPPDDPHFGGAMFVLRVKGQPAAVLYCLRAGKALHAWFVGYDAAHSAASPGLIVFIEAIRSAAAAGYIEMDLGPGDYAFKESLATHARPIGAGFIGRPGLASTLKAAQFQVRALVESLPVGRVRKWPAKAMRRLDIAQGLSAPRETPHRAA